MRNLDADDRRQPLADVVAGDALLQVLRKIVLRRVGVDRARQRRPEPERCVPPSCVLMLLAKE